MISLTGNAVVVRVLLYIIWTATLLFPLIAHYLYMSVVHLPKQYAFFEDRGQWVSSCWKTQLYFSFLCTYIHLQAMQNPGKLRDEEGNQFHVSADTCTCKPVVKQISSQDHTSCQWVFWYDFHWHHLLRNRHMKPSVVAKQKTVQLCCDLYQMFARPLRTAQICHPYWTDYRCLSTMRISSDDMVICCSGE